MLTSELVTGVRLAARLDDSDDDYTDARVRTELTQCLQKVFGTPIVNSRDGSGARTGFWLKQYTYTTDADTLRYRFPYRALGGVVETIELADTFVSTYQIIGDQVVFTSAPTDGSELIFTYYLRPSALVAEQSTAGRVTGKDEDARTVSVTSVPTDRVTAATVASGDKLDIVHPNGWHELALVNIAATLVSTTFTFPTGTDLSDVEVGDFVRAADQTDWPCLPDEFHQALVLMTAAKILSDKGYEPKAKARREEAAADLEKFADLIEPRVKDGRNLIVPTVGVLRGRPAMRWPRTAV